MCMTLSPHTRKIESTAADIAAGIRHMLVFIRVNTPTVMGHNSSLLIPTMGGAITTIVITTSGLQRQYQDSYCSSSQPEST